MHKSWYKIPTSAKNPKPPINKIPTSAKNPKPPIIEEQENKIHKSQKKLSYK